MHFGIFRDSWPLKTPHGLSGKAIRRLPLLCILVGVWVAHTTVVTAQPTPTENIIHVWKVGSPHRGDLPDTRMPDDLSRKALKFGFRLEIRSMQARDLNGLLMSALATNDEPDILVIDNMGLIIGINTQLGHFEGIGRDPRVRDSAIMVSEAFRSLQTTKGWEFLFKTSRNFAKAKSLAMMEPECNPGYGKNGPWTGSSKTDLENTATTAASAYLRRDLPALDALVGGRYLADSELFRRTPSVILSNKVCGGWGNQRLAFINTVTLFENDEQIGYDNLLQVLENTEGSWKLLSLTGDAGIIARLQAKSLVLKDGAGSDAQLQPPTLIAPADGASFSRWPVEERPWLEWTSAGGGFLYLIEAQFTNPPRPGQAETLWSGTGFRLISPVNPDVLKIRTRATFGAGQQPHRWRVWAIDENGFTTRSEWRVVNYIN